LTAGRAGAWLSRQWPALLVLFGVALVAWVTSPTDGDFWWYDSCRHAMNGVFMHDFFAQGGWRSPMTFARGYYEQYPAINIGFYPPLLYVVMAVALGLFGVSHAVCQAVIAAFAGAAAAACYALARPRFDRLTAVAVALVAVLTPEMALWSRQVQPDVPALAWLLWGAWALARYLETSRTRFLWWSATLFGCAISTRVQTIFLVPVWLGVLFLHPQARQAALKLRLATTAWLGLLAAPAVLGMLYFARIATGLATAMPGMPPLLSLGNWSWYLVRFPALFGLAGVLVVVVGVIVWLTSARSSWAAALSGRAGLMTAFALAAWLFFTVVSNKDVRFGMPIEPFALLAAALLWAGSPSRLAGAARWAMLLGAAVAAVQIARADALHAVPRVTGHAEAARLVAELAPPHGRVLVSAHRDGNFIFDLRTLTTRPDLSVLRADKLLVDILIVKDLGEHDKALSADAIAQMLARKNVGVVVSQTDYLDDLPSMHALREMLDSGCCYTLSRTITVTGEHNADERELRVYVRR